MADKKKTLYIEDDVLNNLEQDTFGHKHIANAIVQSIINTKPPYIIGIFGGWGTGKSSLLTMIKSDLIKKNIATVTIDAWRYSSAENLRRAFLVHVANELSKGLLGELRRRLYTTEQEMAPKQKSKIEKPTGINWNSIQNIFLTFILITLIFLGFLFIAFSIKTLFQINAPSEFFVKFDRVAFIDKFIDLAFVPFLLTLVNYLSFYIVQHPVTITHERIDADELLSYYFQKIIDQVTKKKKRLVIFIDNLDRLNDDKMVDALESIKAYINNDNCVFVVACDDNVVRSVVNQSPAIPKALDGVGNERRAGEHYLDKFFQQTFRLPEYMAINLHDFALENLKTTYVYDELISQTDINNLVSIILPSDVGSPRKVKRLLNEFISLYEIVKRRENESDGQLKKGTLTENLEFLGKFSTLRAEYPSFYKALITDSASLTRFTDMIQDKGETVENSLKDLGVENIPSLISYLRRTQTIVTADIDAYIWLSQDVQALGLRGNHYSLLRTSLADGNVDQVKSLLDSAEDKEYRVLLARVSSRLVTQRLVGIEKQNGVRVLSRSLSQFDNSVQPEIANVVANLIPEWPADVFSAEEILNVLRWAYGTSISSQKERLVTQILERLQNPELREPTFSALLQNADVIENNLYTSRVQGWLADILKPEHQEVLKGTPEEETTDKNLVNRDFAEWLISEIPTYSGNDRVVDNYYSQDLAIYAVLRLLGTDSIQGVFLHDIGLGQNISHLFQVLAERIRNSSKNSRYWNAVLNLIEETDYLEDIEFSIDHVSNSLEFLPDALTERFVIGMFLSLGVISKKAGNDKVADHELTQLLDRILKVTDGLRKMKGQEFNAVQLEKLPGCISEIMLLPFMRESLLDFVSRFAKIYDKWEADLFTMGILLAMTDSSVDVELDKKVINKVLDLDSFVSNENKDKVLSRIDHYLSSNEQDKVDLAVGLLGRIVSMESYKVRLETASIAWLERLGLDDTVPVFQSRINLFDLLIDNKLLNPDGYVAKIINLLPFGGNKDQLQITFSEIEKLGKRVSLESGKALFNAVIANIGFLGTGFPKALDIVSRWVDNAEDSERLAFDSNVVSLYESSINEYLPIQSVTWAGMAADQVRDHLVQIWRVEIDDNLRANRAIATKNAFKVIDSSKRQEVSLFVWNNLMNNKDIAEPFMYVVKGLLSHNDIANIRHAAIDVVRENNDQSLSIQNLRLLAATSRDDVDDVSQVVDLFVNLFGRGADDVQMAATYIDQCLQDLELTSNHRYYLSEAMSKAVTRTDDEIEIIEQKAKTIKLRWFKYKRKDKDKDE